MTTSSSNKKKNIFGQVLLFIGLYISVQILLGFPLGIYQAIKSANIEGKFVPIDASSPGVILYSAIVSLLTGFILLKIYKSIFNDEVVNFNKSKITPKSLLIALALAVFSFIAVSLIGLLSPVKETSEVTKIVSSTGLIGVFTAVIAAPVNEEIIFRGILFKVFEDHSKIAYVIVSSIFFGLMHIQFTGNTIQDILPVIMTAIIGILLSIVYNKERNIYLNIFTHAIYNSFVLIVMSLI